MTSMKVCPVLNTDAYKLSHKGFMDENTEYVYSNMTPRSAKHLSILPEYYDNKVVFFGLQYFIKEYLIEEWNANFFKQPKNEIIKILKRRIDNYLGKNSVPTTHFEELHDLQYLPLEIKALEEGSIFNVGVPFLTIINTNPKFAWLTNYIETIFSCEIWKPIVNATIAREFNKLVRKYALKTSGNVVGTEFQIHGFEFRGMSGRQDAAICGAATLLFSVGTDTIPAIDLLEQFYNANSDIEFIASSIPASEHAVTSLGTSVENELEFFRKSITKSYPTGMVSLVSDTYDFFKVITEFTKLLKEDILNRKPNQLGLAKVIFRPDSGNPIHIICGDPKAEIGTPEYKGAVECLWDVFGGTNSNKNYKVLHERVGLVYGDSISLDIANQILIRLERKGFASSNCVFGVGSFTRNLLSRDCLSIAQKATWAQVNGVGYDLFKAPKTDSGSKKSAKGLLQVKIINGEFILKDCCTWEEERDSELTTVFKDGKLVRETTLAEIRARVAKNL